MKGIPGLITSVWQLRHEWHTSHPYAMDRSGKEIVARELLEELARKLEELVR